MVAGGRVLLVSARAELQAAVRRLVVLAGAELEVVDEIAAVRARWRSSSLVLVGFDLAAALVASGLPRRDGVVIVADGPVDTQVWQLAVSLGATEVFRLPDDQRGVVDLLSEALDEPTAFASTYAVIGGSGGAGASTLSAALALTSSRASSTVLIDADPIGGGIDVLLGAELKAGARWPALADARGHLGSEAFAQALLRVDELAVLSQDRNGPAQVEPAAADAVLSVAARAFSTVVIDLPRYLDPAALVFAAAADVVLLVMPATVRGAAAASMVAASVTARCASLSLVVRDSPGHLTVGEIATALALPVVAEVHTEAWVAAAAVRGELPVRRGRGSLHETCQSLLADLSIQAEAA